MVSHAPTAAIKLKGPSYRPPSVLIHAVFCVNTCTAGNKEPVHKGHLHRNALVMFIQGGITPVPSVLPSATTVKLGQDGKWPLTFDFPRKDA